MGKAEQQTGADGGDLHDYLIAAYGLVLLDFVVWRMRWPANEARRLITRLFIFGFLTGALLASGLSPLAAVPKHILPLHRVVAQVAEIIWWLTGARLLSMSLDILLLPEAWRRQRLFQDVFGAVVFMAAVVAALGFVLELPIRGLVATSGALAIVLGLAIQSTLSDVFAGVVLNTTEPYQVGDFIVVDGIEGQVVEMNWRATHLLNGQGNTVIVPNAVVSKTKITNNSRPPNVHGVKVGLELDPGLVPHAVLGALDDACAACADLLPAPKPIATIKQMSTTSVQYEVTAYVASASEKIQAFNGLFDLCHRHLAAAGMRPRVLGIAANGEPDNPNLTVMSHSAIFSMTGIDERIALAEKLSARRFRKGEVLSAAGQTLDELHLVKNGVLSATTLVNDEQKHVRRLGPGDTFGELSVLAMRPETQTYSALTDGIVLVLDGKSFAALAQANREFLDAVCDALHDRDELASAKPDGLQTPASGQSLVEWLVEKVKSIHALAF